MRLSIWFGIVVTCAGARVHAADRVTAWTDTGLARGVAVGSDGTTYVTGARAGTFHLDPAAADTVRGDDQNRPFVIAFDADHRATLTKTWDDAALGGNVIATDDGPIVALSLRGPELDTGCAGAPKVRRRGDQDIAVLIAMTRDGACRWTWSGASSALALAPRPGGGVVIAGRGDKEGFVAALDRDGHVTWRQALARHALPFALASTADAIFVTGWSPDHSAGEGVVAPAFLARLDFKGHLAWSRTIGSAKSTTLAFSVAADADRVVIGGLFRGKVDFDPGPGEAVRTSTDVDDDGFVAMFDRAGTFAWVYTYGAKSSDQVRGVALGPARVYAVGNQTNVVDLGGPIGALDPATKLFLVTLDEHGAPLASRTLVSGRDHTYAPVYVAAIASTGDRAWIAGDLSGYSGPLGVLGQKVRASAQRSPLVLELSLDR